MRVDDMAGKDHHHIDSLNDEAMLIFYVRPARSRARSAAVAEALHLLHPWHAITPSGGPLSERGGLFWLSLPGRFLEEAATRFPWLGYTSAVEWLEPQASASPRKGRRSSGDIIVRWRGRLFKPVRIYEENPGELRESAPDRRTFLLETEDGAVRAVRGYRGDGEALGRRALPVCDARLLTNLVYTRQGDAFLDPFAGAGGIVREAILRGFIALSSDRDPILRHGLTHLGSLHCVADACLLPFSDESVDAIATEPPYHQEAWQSVTSSLGEMARVLRRGGRLSMLCALGQAEGLRQMGERLGLSLCHDFTIGRKGLDCAALVWEKR